MQANGARMSSEENNLRRASESEKDMTTAKGKASDEAQIRALIEDNVRAVRI
jgi:hypothetical protein